MGVDIGNKIGERILELRLSKKMTQEQLAEKAQIDPSVISRIERGTRTNLRLNTLDKIVNALGTDYETIFSFSENTSVNKRITSKLALINDSETLQTIEKLIDLLINAKS
ncbi:helix-turn-helix domain-containing protein [Secundilactobacillus mixtipabuli]|uniref:XRE family transcriptional regulator n=1 Tax=Secundilactobacillus mixtipabuli TaxID=1435342 RepID=A0A1Z5ICR9_9LACO|nr:helix-turn-helix transcriptional regulator [Secundilactobacillus mixtipabuli]GAW99576.1 XRE family transcriptional regulator [Secundilactobacillus mixtipabuli]